MSEQRTMAAVEKSQAAFAVAGELFPGGVNSPVRAFGAVGGTPRFIAKAEGAILTDIDGHEYVDYVGSWGAMILGHNEERVSAAISKALSRGWSFGAPTELESRLAEAVIQRMPSVQMLRFVSSGTEAVMSAVRLARGYTGRDKVIKCEGCYHGHVDALLVQAGSGAATFGVPSSAGIPQGVIRNTVVVPYNDLAAVEEAVRLDPDSIAALIVEPVAANMGLVPPRDGYLEGLREICDRRGIVLIFDEVVTGFRVHPGGAQGLYGAKADLTCLGKVLGGGMPIGAYGGAAEIMKRVSPAGPVYQAGTLSGHPLAMAAGLATLQALDTPEIYDHLAKTSRRLHEGLVSAASKKGLGTYQPHVESLMCTFFTPAPVWDWTTAARSDTQQYAKFFHLMLNQGIYLAPSQFECMFVSAAHTDELIDRTVAAAEVAFTEIHADSQSPQSRRTPHDE